MEQITMTIEETRRYLGIGKTTIYALINSNRLNAVKIGRRTLVTVASIRALIADNMEAR